MEAVGAGASILTFITVAFSVSKSIHDTLSAIKDGPEVLRFLKDELSQLQGILQGLLQTSITAVGASDVSELHQLVKKCQDDLVGFNTRLCQFDISGADGRRGRLWRKLKLAIEEKDLDHIRQVIKGHVQLLTLRLGIVQAQQLSLTAKQSTQMLDILQQLQQGIRALQVSGISAPALHSTLTCASPRVVELDDAESPVPQKTILEDSIARLMRLVEKRPCVVESDESEELLDDLKQVLRSVQNDLLASQHDALREDNRHDISQELKFVKRTILSSPSIMINQNGTYMIFNSELVADNLHSTTERLHYQD
ncbi:hypothetical protein FIE12Z_3220 [Fusarium flagelliforme]|uniref:Azaphilone pigments biosynthesis cluster protein L N-terminal domain-containing protein n=1 Tax=Fusarium flagelliforme TaxID=2675880 RepID=A0A395MZ11_9HYPO|nr:hypothetical protein FIE12Z_3220 [Fusarium flagelliforme]